MVGQRAQREFKAGDLFFESDLKPPSAKKSAYRFSRPYGIPARYHDYRTLTEGMELDFVEFHLSYHDLDVDLAEALHAPQSLGFVVHSPELFAGDHILDLASDDADYRRHSVAELKHSSHRLRPSPTVNQVGVFTLFTRLLLGSLALRPVILCWRNSRPSVSRTPLRNTTKVYEQLLRRDSKPQVNQLVTEF